MTDPSAPPATSPLLTTKLYRPHAPATLVSRPRLLEALTAGLDQQLILVSAPAGYGKTTVISQWLDSVNLPWAWMSVDEHDSEPVTFLRYFLAAVRSVYPDANSSTEPLLSAPYLPAPDRLADFLLHDLGALPRPLVLVLDDYHMIQTADVHAMMTRLVQHLPPHVHLILVTRADPPLPLERLRGRQQLTELRSTDLSFTLDEAGQLLRQMIGPAATAETTAALVEGTEGWAVGLQLAAISVRDRSDPVAFARRIAQSGHQLVTDYLLAEVLEGLPEATRACLLQASLLDRFCAPLLDAIRGEANRELAGEAFLRSARRSNLFLVPLDSEGTWFRYHHLFRYLLSARTRERYADAEIRNLHACASAWFAAHNLLDEAIAHAVKAGDILRAAELVEAQVHPSLDREDWRQVERWLGLLPPEVLRRPRLLLAQAWIQYIRFGLAALNTMLDDIEAVLAAEPGPVAPALSGEINALRAALVHAQDRRQETVTLAQAALQQLPREMKYAVSIASMYSLLGLQMIGQGAEAVRYGQQQLAILGPNEWPIMMRVLLGLMSYSYEQADLPALQSVATTQRRMAAEMKLALSLPWSSFALGWLCYQRNELGVAEQHFRELAGMAYSAHGISLINGFTGLALTLAAQGCRQAAQEAAGQLRIHLLERGMLAYLPSVDSLQHRLAGAPSDSATWRYDPRTANLSLLFWELPMLTQARTLLNSGTPTDLAQAAKLLADCQARALARYDNLKLIEVKTLLAQLLMAQGQESAALAVLRDAIQLAMPGGALRLFVDSGPGLMPLLRKLAAEREAPAYIQSILAAFGSGPEPTYDGDIAAAPTPRAPAELLTNREIDVLMLLAERLTNKEIAERLVLSPETVKKHTAHIYEKLGVDNRRAAVARGSPLGLDLGTCSYLLLPRIPHNYPFCGLDNPGSALVQ